MPDFPIDPTTTSGTELANILNRLFQNITINWFASQAEVDAGTINDKYIAPDKLKGRSTATGGTAADSGKYPQLDAAGRIPLGMLPAQVTGAFKPQGTFDPTAGPEYPAPTGLTAGWIYILDKAHTFAGGDLATLSLPKGDMIYWGADNKWHAAGAQIDDSGLVKTDGSNPMLKDLNFGTKKGINLADATAGTDALNKQTGETLFVEVAGDTMTGDLDIDTHSLKYGTDAEIKYDTDHLEITTKEANFTGDLKSRDRFVAVSFETLTINIGGAGASVTPNDPIGDGVGSGNAFDKLSTALTWLHARVVAEQYIFIFAGGTPYSESAEINLYDMNILLKSTGAVTINFTSDTGLIGNSTLVFDTGSDFTITAGKNGIVCADLSIKGTLTINAAGNGPNGTVSTLNSCTVFDNLNITSGSTKGAISAGGEAFSVRGTATINITQNQGAQMIYTRANFVTLDGHINALGTTTLIHLIESPLRYVKNPSLVLGAGVSIQVSPVRFNPADGYQLDNGTGQMVMWGEVNATTNPQPITFPGTFKNLNYFITATIVELGGGTGSELIKPDKGSKKPNGIDVYLVGNPFKPYRFHYHVIGEGNTG